MTCKTLQAASLVAQLAKNLPAMWETWVWSLGWEDPLEKGKAIHSSMLAWRTPWTVESMGSQRVGHDWATFTTKKRLYSTWSHPWQRSSSWCCLLPLWSSVPFRFSCSLTAGCLLQMGVPLRLDNLLSFPGTVLWPSLRSRSDRWLDSSVGREAASQCRRRRSPSSSGRSPGGGNGNPLQYSCLGNPMDRGAWWATVHGVIKSWTWLRASLIAELVKNLPAMQETWVWFLGWEDSPGEGNGNPLKYSCLENPHGQRSLVGYSPWGCKSRTRLSDFHYTSLATKQQKQCGTNAQVKYRLDSHSLTQACMFPGNCPDRGQSRDSGWPRCTVQPWQWVTVWLL